MPLSRFPGIAAHHISRAWREIRTIGAKELTMTTFMPGNPGSAPARTGTLFRRTLERLTPAEELKGRRYVENYALLLDDAMLATYGLDPRTRSHGIHAQYPW
jgi:hypothetical protein